jgi:hypothetical protein
MLYYQCQLPKDDVDSCLSALTLGLTSMPFLKLKILKKEKKKVIKPPRNSINKIKNLYLFYKCLRLLHGLAQLLNKRGCSFMVKQTKSAYLIS